MNPSIYQPRILQNRESFPHISFSKKKKSAFSEVKLIYAGNIGIFQNLELLVGILLNEEIPNISLTIIGEGVPKQNISKMISNHKNQANSL